jgi:acyl-CoA thioester hydrolase
MCGTPAKPLGVIPVEHKAGIRRPLFLPVFVTQPNKPMDQNPNLLHAQLQIRVYYEDTDAGGVMYYANYLKFFERARTEWLRKLGVQQSVLAASENLLFVVKNVQIQYRKPARLDDLLNISSHITRVGPASITFHQTASCQGNVLCESDILVCCVREPDMRPAALTPELRNLLEKAKN